MKKIGSLFGLILFVLVFQVQAAGAMPELSAQSAILIDAGSGRVLFEKNAHDRLPQASTTKITTALIAMEGKQDLKKKITVPSSFVNPGEAGIWLEPGEQHTMEDMLYALLLRSANDAAAVIAYGVSGSEENFVELMNRRVKELGLKDTHYMNPHGLYHENHYSSAYDLAMITKEAMTHKEFCQIIVTKRHVLPWPGHDYSRVVYNGNRLLGSYPGANGVKTGFTRQAGSCLVGSATRNGLHLIAVVLHANAMYDEVGLLLDYGFENFKNEHLYDRGEVINYLPVTYGKKKQIGAVMEGPLSIAVQEKEKKYIRIETELPKTVKAPVEKGEKLGSVKVYVGEEIFKMNVLAEETIKKKSFIFCLWDRFCHLFSLADAEDDELHKRTSCVC